MKKVLLTLTTALAMASSLCACGNKADKDSSTAADIDFIAYNADYYENGVVLGRETAMFLDFETMEKAPLCAAPNCTHTTSSCLATLVGDTPVFYNGYIYFFESNYGDVRETPDGPEFFIDSKLKKASLDSSETEVVCKFTDCAPINGFPSYVLYNNELYFVGDDCNPQKGAYGNYSWGNSGGTHFLCSIDLDTGEYTNYGSIYDGDKEYDGAAYSSQAKISGVYNDKMYISYGFVKDNKKLQQGIIDYFFVNFEFDFETKTWTESELPYSKYINKDTYTYYDPDEGLLHVIYKGDEATIPVDYEIVVMCEFNGKLFLPTEEKWYELADMSEHSFGEYNGYEVIGYYDDSYILTNTLNTVKLTEEELLSL